MGAEHVVRGAAPGGVPARDQAERARRLRDRVRENFDRGAGEYARFEDSSFFFRRLLDELLAGGPSLEGARVLDVGCGTGASLESLQERVGPAGRVCGVDLSLPMLRQARARLGPGAQLAVLDGCELASAFRVAFDAVVYNAVLFLLPDAGASLASARGVLVPGGRVYLSNLEGVYWDTGRSVPGELLARGYPAGRHALSPWGAVAQALGQGFEGVQIRRWSVGLTPEQFLAFYGLEPMSAGLLPGLPFLERRRVVQELAEEAAAEGRCLEQVWVLASARNPRLGGGSGEGLVGAEGR
ncbi:MAG: class I SAM-dependent methyltransferase [Deferrisomatales bacterium]|nr:class I SAM-dependent methyltransferase [Deferrisomatales bacterium]